MDRIDLTDRNVVTGKNLEAIAKSGAKEIAVRPGAVLTSTAKEAAAAYGISIIREPLLPKEEHEIKPFRPAYMRAQSSVPEALYRSAEAQAAKEEIVRVGKKLWQREYVDGNGGNISFRLNKQYVLCTPTLVSKGDLTVDDIVLVDLGGVQVAGRAPCTSEILMHLAIYRNQPKARACVHAHPPHATAYAITGRTPPTCIIPEQEVFVGVVGLTSYETPGTQAFADLVEPICVDHNTILLANHGVVCWADTITHAEWYMEVIESYCHTLILASQIGSPVLQIPGEKAKDLLEIKKRLDLPDPRLLGQEATLCDMPEVQGGIVACPKASSCGKNQGSSCCGQATCANQGQCASDQTTSSLDQETETLIQKITDQIMQKLISVKA